MDYNWLTPKAMVKRIDHKGMGSFAIKEIKTGEVVASFGGYVVKNEKLKNFSKDRVARSLQVNGDLYILSGKNPESGDMLNHSCDPNCGALGVSTIVAMKDIPIGSELTFDYAMTDASIYDEFECFCGKENCRKKITGTDWKDKNLQKKYKNYFSDFISSLILKSQYN